MNKKISIAALSLAVSLFAVTTVLASTYSLEGGAEYVTPGKDSDRGVLLTSNNEVVSSSINFSLSENTMFSDLTYLGTDFKLSEDDVCAGGSPRFQINLQNGTSTQNVFAYFGSYPSYDDCASNEWVNTGNLLQDGMYVDTSQLAGGTFYDLYENALERYSDYAVTGIQIVVDGYWAATGSEQVVTIDNTKINAELTDYEEKNIMSKDECKNEGWMNLTDDNGNGFRNQGQCIRYYNTQQ